MKGRKKQREGARAVGVGGGVGGGVLKLPGVQTTNPEATRPNFLLGGCSQELSNADG